MVNDIERQIKQHAIQLTREACSQLFDASRQAEKPDEAMESYITLFTKSVILETMKLSNDKEVFLDRINPFLSAAWSAETRKALKENNESTIV